MTHRSVVLLDRTGDADLPTGYTLVTTEREFLASAGCDPQLMVRGPALCDWAVAFYTGRQIAVQETESPLVFLHDLCPDLTPEQAAALLALIRPQLHNLARPWRLPALLQLLYPNALWDEHPSSTHAAAWLLWLHQSQPALEDAPLRAALTERWQQSATGPEAALYAVDTHAAATEALLAWLDVEAENLFAALRPFPIELPSSLIDEAKRRWKKTLAQSQGQALPMLLARPLIKSLRLALVQVAFDHFNRQPKHLTNALFAKLSPALTTTQQDKLRGLLPPPPPPSLPAAPVAMAGWFRDHYLPYRLWQANHGDDDATAHVHAVLHAFAAWYLDHYRTALAGGPLAPLLAFNMMASLRESRDTNITLVVVLDGLQLADAQQLLRALDAGTDRLTFVSYDLAFAPLPTVTEFCKDSLFRGVPPVHIPNVAPMGDIEADLAFPVAKLDTAKPGQIVFWRIMEPDATYHDRNTSAKLSYEIEAALDGVAAKLVDVVETLEARHNLRLVITTDHGRLLGTAARTLPVPLNMQSHSRAAWGKADPIFPEGGYVLEGEIAYLHRAAFALPTDAAVVIGEQAFYTADGRTGSEICPHGGLSPEEVIIPWFVALRDFRAPELDVQITGHGRAEATGRLAIAITNTGAVAVTCTRVMLHFVHGRSIKLDVQVICAPSDHVTATIDMTDWPTVQAAQAVTAAVRVVLPNGRDYTLATNDVALTSEEMYTRTDILEGLDLMSDELQTPPAQMTDLPGNLGRSLLVDPSADPAAVELNRRIKKVFGALAIDKRRLPQSQLQKRGIPAYVGEWVLDTIVPGEGPLSQEDEAKVQKWAARFIPTPDETNVIKHWLLSGKLVKVLTVVQVEVVLTRQRQGRVAKMSLLGIGDALINDGIIEAYPDLLKQGMWGVVELMNTKEGVMLNSFKPMQASVNLALYKDARRNFSLAEWRSLMLSSMGYNPAFFDEEEQLFLLCRLLPLVQKNMHLMELAPKGTGKSYVFENINPRVRLISGGNVSPAVLFVNNQSGQWGLLARYGVVVLDEVQTLKFEKPEEIIGGLKGFLANGRLTRGGLYETASDCSLVLLANILLDSQQRPVLDPIVQELPSFLQETAFLDRIRGLVPGWKIRKLSGASFAKGLGLKSDFFGDALMALRNDLEFDQIAARRIQLVGAKVSKRNEDAVHTISSGLMKILFPHGEVSTAEFEYYCVRTACSLRQMIWDQLQTLDGEYRQYESTIRYELND